jgi:hypothetical protein
MPLLSLRHLVPSSSATRDSRENGEGTGKKKDKKGQKKKGKKKKKKGKY